MKRVYVISESFSGGGAERIMAHLVNEGGSFGLDIIPISLTPNNSYLDSGALAKCKIAPQFVIFPRKIARLLSILSVGLRLKRNSNIFISSYILLIILHPFLWFKNINTIFRPSIDFDYIEEEISDRFGVVTRYFIRVFLNSALRASNLLFQTDFIANSFSEKMSKKKRLTVPNPVRANGNSLPSFVGSSTDNVTNSLNIVFIGRLVEEKGFDRFLLNLSNYEGIDLKCYFCGEGPQKDPLAQIASNRNIDIKFLGFINLKDLDVKNGLMFLPSRVEGFPNIVLEAALAGWPVAVSREVKKVLQGSPVSNLVSVFDCDKPINAAVLKNIVSKHSFEELLDQICFVRQRHSMQYFCLCVTNLLR